MSKLPVHQPGVYNIDRAVNDGWTCVGNRGDKQDALAIAGKQAALTGARHRVCAPGGEVIFDSVQASPDAANLSPIQTQFVSGKGVLTISMHAPDEIVLQLIKEAIATGKPFTVVPIEGPLRNISKPPQLPRDDP